MSIAEMQACLARLYVDEAFRKLFYLDPATLDEYRLTDKEAAAVRGIDRAMLEYYAASLKNKRRGRIERAYPVLFALDQAELTHYYSRYYQLYTSRAGQLPQQDVLDFGMFVEESVVGADHMPPYTADIARYERLYYQVRFAPRFCAATASAAQAAPHRITADDDVPFLRDGIEIADFEYDVAELEERLHAGGAAPDARDLVRAPSTIAFRPSTSTSATKMLRLNGATRAVLDRCDGSRTVAAIAAELEAALGGRNLGPDIAAVLDRLIGVEVLTLDPQLAAVGKDTRVYGSVETEGM
jgi:hypothetical protein